MRRFVSLIAVFSFLPAPAWCASPVASAASLNVGRERLVIGQIFPRVDAILDCRESAIQHTVRSCSIKKELAKDATSVGRRVQEASLTVDFRGRVVNMSLAFDPSLGFDVLLGDYKLALGRDPKLQYWGDDACLNESDKWVDDETEVELARTLKGQSLGGPVRVYVSSFAGAAELSPDDAK